MKKNSNKMWCYVVWCVHVKNKTGPPQKINFTLTIENTANFVYNKI